MKIEELNKIEFSNAPEDLVELVNKCPAVYYTLLPYSQKPFFVKAKGGGYILLKGANHCTHAMIFGNVTREDLDIDNPIHWFFNTNEDIDNSDYTLFDFKVEQDAKKIKKCKYKHSYNRIVNDENITYREYVGVDETFWFDNKVFEIERLLNKWKEDSKSDVPITLKNVEHYIKLKNKNLVKIAYRCNGVLSGLQVFEIVGENIYWLVNVCLRDKVGKCQVCWIHPIEYFSYKPIHYLGAIPMQHNLFNHKMDLCGGKYWKFKKIVVPSETQSKEKRIKSLNKLYEYLNI